MYKHWWLKALCLSIAAAPVLIAGSKTTSSQAAVPAGRSRLQSYAEEAARREPHPLQMEESTDLEEAQAEIRGRAPLSIPTATTARTANTRRTPSGNTGTFSPLTPEQSAAVTSGRAVKNTAVSDSGEAGPRIIRLGSAPRSGIQLVGGTVDNPTTPRTTSQRVTSKRINPLSNSPRSLPVEVLPEESVEERSADELLQELRQQNRYLELLETAQAKSAGETTARSPQGTGTRRRTEPRVQRTNTPVRAPLVVDNNPFDDEDEIGGATTANFEEEADTAPRGAGFEDVSEVSFETRRRTHPAPVTQTGHRVTDENPFEEAPETTSRGTIQPRTTARTTSPRTQPSATGIRAAAGRKPQGSNSQSPSHAARPGFATGAPQVTVQWVARGEINLGQECRCSLLVKNSGRVAAEELIVEAELPESVRLVDAQPIPQSTGRQLEWSIPHLEAGEELAIDVTLIPTRPGELAAAASVRFTGTTQASFQVAEPQLKIEAQAPRAVQLGETGEVLVRISNPGSGTAQQVTVTSVLENAVSESRPTAIGSLAPGESRTVRLTLPQAQAGEHQIRFVAHSSTGNLEAESQSRLVVIAPKLELNVEGPALRYVNRSAKYVLNATNSSRAASDNVRISEVLPEGIDFLHASSGGAWDAETRTVSWYLGRVEAGQTVAVELEIQPRELGAFQQQFELTADASVSARQTIETRVEGVAALSMRVMDLEDPVEVGTEAGYEIRVRNTGSKAASRVGIACELPAGAELVQAQGPVPHIVQNGILIFRQLEQLPAGDEVIFRVILKGTETGSGRLRSRLTSASIQKPLIVEEATEFYGE